MSQWVSALSRQEQFGNSHGENKLNSIRWRQLSWIIPRHIITLLRHDNDEFLFFILYNDFVDISVYDYLESKNEIN
jgi:hypothetical protein